MLIPAFPEHAEASSTRVWILDDQGMVVESNAAALQAHNADERDWTKLWPHAHRDACRSAIANALEGRAATFTAFIANDEGRRYWRIVVCASPGPGAGALLAFAQDDTVQIETERFLQSVIDLLPLPLIVKSADDLRYRLVNRAVEDAFGIRASAMLGARAEDVFTGPFVDEVDRLSRTALGEDEMIHRLIRTRSPVTGAPLDFEISTVTICDAVGPRYIVSISQDLTEHLANREGLESALLAAQVARRAKTAFLANMSHEIRTPLHGIVAGAELLSKLELPEQARRLTDIIARAGEALEKLVADVLDISKIEAGQLTPEIASFDVLDIVRTSGALAALKATGKDVQVCVEIASDPPARVLGDGLRLRQVLGNLLDNAVKFTLEGLVTVRLESAPSHGFRFTVSDTGIGIPELGRETLFERFQQGDVSFTRRFGGSGLGLALARELVQLMGGTLRCDSVEGEGSRFWFDLDLPTARPAPPPAPVVGGGKALRVLLADDHPANRTIIELMLGELAQVVAVEDGAQALAAFRDGAFDVVLMDMQMPVMDGLTAIAEIRRWEQDQDRVRTPIVMLTANCRPEHHIASLTVGADRHLAKPVTSQALLSVIAETRGAVGSKSSGTR